jgi:hypothetical protein
LSELEQKNATEEIPENSVSALDVINADDKYRTPSINTSYTMSALPTESLDVVNIGKSVFLH